jgi:hypothetical protein
MLLALLVAATSPVAAQDRGTFWDYDSLPPSLAIADIERHFDEGLDGLFLLGSVRCHPRSEPGLWKLTSMATEPYGHFMAGRSEAFHLIVAGKDSVIQYRVEQGRRERIAHSGDSYAGTVTTIDPGQYEALAALAEEVAEWCESEGAIPAVMDAPQHTSVTIGGMVRDHGADLHLPDALVQLLQNDEVIAQVMTTGSGSFRLATRPGRFILRARLIGYQEIEVPIRVADNNSQMELRLVPLPVNLDAVVVVGDSTVPAQLRGFYERRERGWGSFLTREEIEMRLGTYPRAVDALRTMGGLRVRSLGRGYFVHTTRRMCASSIGPANRAPDNVRKVVPVMDGVARVGQTGGNAFGVG